uniref:Uncharacterized protein n=1 Tax=Falco tinnunculus TaxID=100819 RepID=A0A8C4UXH0_FALTI
VGEGGLEGNIWDSLIKKNSQHKIFRRKCISGVEAGDLQQRAAQAGLCTLPPSGVLGTCISVFHTCFCLVQPPRGEGPPAPFSCAFPYTSHQHK